MCHLTRFNTDKSQLQQVKGTSSCNTVVTNIHCGNTIMDRQGFRLNTIMRFSKLAVITHTNRI